MAFYPCFISFRHFDDEISEAFIKQFVDCLNGYLTPLVGVGPFIDYKRMQAGYKLSPAIADAICNSACMIVIWTPQYFTSEHIWCAMEYKAMIDLEKKRLSLLPGGEQFKGLIIPVIYRGSKYYPSKLADQEIYLNFEKFGLYEEVMMKNKKFAEEIEKLADYIADRIDAFRRNNQNPWGSCNGFQLPSENDTKQFIQAITGVAQNTQAFPFR
ncbi:MAG TPA: toll/interleukin-1 receptor domain-containing protein [Chitinophagaceae bacterium]|nr:toll/interleukin-1 receptor domain-containing protein [Chitinophagaceae bacterium]